VDTTHLHQPRDRWQALEYPAELGFVHATGPRFESTDPAVDGFVVARLAGSTEADLDAAADAALAAFRSSGWASDGQRRQRVLTGWAAELRANADRLAELLTLEQGKTLFESQVEVAGAAQQIDFYAGLARAIYGRSSILGERVHAVVLREPIGVVGVITPWNWPLTLLTRAVAPALAAGNAVVVKPAVFTSAVTIETLACLTRQPDFPAGLLGCILGGGAGEIGEALVAHEAVEMISFTGSTATGIRVMQNAAKRLKKVSLELGGKSPNIVFADANMDKAAAGVETAFFTTTGQICTAGSRVLVEEAAYEPLLERLAERVRSVRVGDGLDAATEMGPLVNPQQAERVRGFVERGRAEGELVASGAAPAGPCYVAPAVFHGLPASSSLWREEIFGPVIAIQTFSSDEEAIALANDTEYGLAAAVWTQNLDRAWAAGRGIRAGTIWINTYNHFYDEIEVGGYGASGLGRQSGIEGLLEYTETKHLNFDGNASLW
jgi:betaine-aldehyde dehydrogenase